MCRWSVSALSLFCRYSARVMAASPSARVMVAVTGLSLVHRCHWSVAGSSLSLVCRWFITALSLVCRWFIAALSLVIAVGHGR